MKTVLYEMRARVHLAHVAEAELSSILRCLEPKWVLEQSECDEVIYTNNLCTHRWMKVIVALIEWSHE